MNLEKIFYLVVSTVFVTVFVLIVFVFSPASSDDKSGSAGKVIYFADNISPAVQKLIDKFNQEYKGKLRVQTINLSFDKFSTNERKELLARYLRSKNSRIDVFTVDVIWVPRFSRWTKNLNQYFDSSFVKNLPPHTLRSCYAGESLVAVPFYTDIALMFYRDDLLKKLSNYEEYSRELASSITWEKFTKLREEIAALPGRGNKPFYLFQADEYEGLMCSFTEVLDNFGGTLSPQSGGFRLNNTAGLGAVEFMTGLVNKRGLSPREVTRFKEMESYEYFFDQEAFAVRGWPGFMSIDNPYFPDSLRAVIKTAPLPHKEGSEPAFVFGGWNLMISDNSENIPEAVEFIKFLHKPENQQMLYREGRILPVIDSLYKSPGFADQFPELIFYKQLFRNGIYRPEFENYTGLSDILTKNLSRAIKDGLDAAPVAEEIDKQISTSIAR